MTDILTLQDLLEHYPPQDWVLVNWGDGSTSLAAREDVARLADLRQISPDNTTLAQPSILRFLWWSELLRHYDFVDVFGPLPLEEEA